MQHTHKRRKRADDLHRLCFAVERDLESFVCPRALFANDIHCNRLLLSFREAVPCVQHRFFVSHHLRSHRQSGERDQLGIEW